MEKLKISIIIPTLNQADYIEQTINSIISQAYKNIEVIVIDGGSTDATLEIVGKYKNYIDYFVSEKDGGQSDAINKGLNLATGEIIGWQNSDDMYHPNVFKVVSNAFINNDVMMVYGNLYRVNSSNKVIQLKIYSHPNIYDMVYNAYLVPNQVTFWRREFINKIGGLNKEYHHAMDFDLCLKSICNLKKSQIVYINSVLGLFREHEKAKTADSSFTKNCVIEINSSIKYNAVKNNIIANGRFFISALRVLLKLKRYIIYQLLYLRKNKKLDLTPIYY